MSLTDLLQAFSLPFISRGVLTMLILACGAGVVSIFVSFRGMEFLTDGLVHAIFPGLVVGFLLGGTALILPAALLTALLAAALITLLTHRKMLANDAAIAVLLTSAFSLGIVLVSRQHNYMAELNTLLFGHLLTVTEQQLHTLTLITLVALLLVLCTWRRQLFLAHDAHGFTAAGFNALTTDMILGAAVAMLVVAGVQALGNLLVIALLIVPATAARQLTNRLPWLVTLSIVLIMLAGVLGIAVSVWLSFGYGINASAGALVVLILILFYALALPVGKLRRNTTHTTIRHIQTRPTAQNTTGRRG